MKEKVNKIHSSRPRIKTFLIPLIKNLLHIQAANTDEIYYQYQWFLLLDIFQSDTY